MGLLVGMCMLLAEPQVLLAQSQTSNPDFLQVGEIRWGFDGRGEENTFLPLWVDVQNIGNTPWQGQLELRRMARGSVQFGSTLAVPVHLQGDEFRQVQFTPFIVDYREDYLLSWGPDPQHQVDVPQFNPGESATMLIFDSDAITPSNSVFRRLPAHQFPTSVTATDGLRGIILDAVPFWQGARARAFEDWLRRGGRVYLLHDESGQFPTFPQTLNVLNRTDDRFSVGRGFVRRIPRQAREFTLDQARREIFNDDLIGIDAAQSVSNSTLVVNSNPGSAVLNPRASLNWTRNADIFLTLRKQVEFKRNWWLIYVAVGCYLLTLFPGCYQIGTQRREVRKFYAAFAGGVVLFSLLFASLGRISGNEQSRLQSAVLAHSLGGQNYDVTGWSLIRNLNAGEYALQHPGSGVLYSTANEFEQTRGVMLTGPQSEIRWQLPHDSRQTLLYRSRMQASLPEPQLISAGNAEQQVNRLAFDITAFAKSPPLLAYMVAQERLYEMQQNGPLLKINPRRGTIALEDYLKRELDYSWNNWGGGTFQVVSKEQKSATKKDLLKEARQLVRPLIGNSYGLKSEIDLRRFRSHTAEVSLFLLFPLPEEFQAETTDVPEQRGVLLVRYDYPLGTPSLR